MTGMPRLSAAATSCRTKSPGSSRRRRPDLSGVQPLLADEREDHVAGLQPLLEHLPEIASRRNAVHVDEDVVPADVVREIADQGAGLTIDIAAPVTDEHCTHRVGFYALPSPQFGFFVAEP